MVFYLFFIQVFVKFSTINKYKRNNNAGPTSILSRHRAWVRSPILKYELYSFFRDTNIIFLFRIEHCLLKRFFFYKKRTVVKSLKTKYGLCPLFFFFLQLRLSSFF